MDVLLHDHFLVDKAPIKCKGVQLETLKTTWRFFAISILVFEEEKSNIFRAVTETQYADQNKSIEVAFEQKQAKYNEFETLLYKMIPRRYREPFREALDGILIAMTCSTMSI